MFDVPVKHATSFHCDLWTTYYRHDEEQEEQQEEERSEEGEVRLEVGSQEAEEDGRGEAGEGEDVADGPSHEEIR